MNRNRTFTRKKFCYITKNEIKYIDFEDLELLKKFMSNNGKILAARATGTKPKIQRQIAIAIKRAQYMALLPYAK